MFCLLYTVAGAQDFLMEEVEVVFMPGEVSKTVAVVTYDDNITEPSEEFVISVVPTNEVALGPHSRVVITIQDNDGKPTSKSLWHIIS